VVWEPAYQIEPMNDAQAHPTREDILIIDDTPENLRLLSTLLIRHGYAVRKAINGRIALMAVQTVQPDLILLDIMMPDINGYEVCKHLKANPHTAKIPVIFLSALSEGIDKARAFSVGGSDYITKPFQLEEVLARVRNQLALRSAEIRNERLSSELEQRVQHRTHQLEVVNQKLRQEILDRRQLQEQLLVMALYDNLTQLPNRVLFMKRLLQSLNAAKARTECQVAVLFLDCDRFKVINDSLGHYVGDELLVAIAHRLNAVTQPNDLLARLGGDEFAILLTDSNSLERATQLAQDILEALTHPFALDHHEIFINASIGIALGNASYSQPEHVLRDADTAMYRAKASGKAQYQLFLPAMHEATLHLLRLETDLRRAVQQQEMAVHYQPIVDLQSGAIVGFEALLRWYHPQQGMIAPSTFIALAEETGLIRSLGNWALQQACQQLHGWQKQGLDWLTVNVNLSPRQLAQSDLVRQIDQILAETQLDPRCLKLELTESAIMGNADSAIRVLKQLKERQIQLCLDDFGTGYSSLSYLHAFPIDMLKIDRSFVERMTDRTDAKGLVPLIINIAHTMGMSVTAEGVETQQQLAQLRELGCALGQGFLFSEAIDSAQAIALIKSAPQW
jgi:diguanylate cyclase (GGDEF)-like protein